MKPFVIVGSGGLGRELLGWIADSGIETRERFRVEAFISEEKDAGSSCHGVPVLHPDDWSGPPPRFIVAVADPEKKKRLALHLQARGWTAEIFIHERVVIGLGARIGAGTVICPFSSVSSDCEIGEHVLVNGRSGVGHDARVGSYTSLLGSVSINGSSIIGEGVLFGAGSMIFPGKKVGDWAKIGIGSIVLRNVRAGAVMFGNPAARIDAD